MRSYDTRPVIDVSGLDGGIEGYDAIRTALRKRISTSERTSNDRFMLIIECYPGVDLDEIACELVEPLEPTLSLRADEVMQDARIIQERIADHITEDRVFGVMSHYTIDQFVDERRLDAARARIEEARGLVVLYGFGATRMAEPDLLVYADLTRWEIQLRQRRGACNWMADNGNEDQLRKFKRGYFFEWRMADREKRHLFDRWDYLLDTNRPGKPAMVEGDLFRRALELGSRRPFRLVPYFDTSVWGGHWMQEHFGLDPSAKNFGWAFDGVPEENSLIFRFSDAEVEVPAMDMVLFQPDNLLGPKVRARFGREFPIRFDYLDTMGGGNLSLQVHPLTEYAQDVFGIHYTQDESYYILDATEDSCVYLGVKEGVDRHDLLADLRHAETGTAPFHDGRFINKIPVKKHDHVLIPAGTIHCSGPNTVVLEISATPYIFTFKLWDWGRVGLDGVPRPVHLDHGEKNIRMDRTTSYVLGHQVDRADAPHENLSSQAGVTEERTGLHELEFIETRRHWFEDQAFLATHESVNMLNLVEGDSVTIESSDGSFAPYEIHYGETFIVPECVREYRIRNTGEPGRRVGVIQAYVRGLEG